MVETAAQSHLACTRWHSYSTVRDNNSPADRDGREDAMSAERKLMESGGHRAPAGGISRGRAAALVVGGLASLPTAVLADVPIADSIARGTPVASSAELSSAPGSETARNPAADWDGLVTLVVSYLESTSESTVTVVIAEPAT
jgi:hypothetical protein